MTEGTGHSEDQITNLDEQSSVQHLKINVVQEEPSIQHLIRETVKLVERGGPSLQSKEYEKRILASFAADLKDNLDYHEGQEYTVAEVSDHSMEDFDVTLFHVAAYYRCVQEIRKLLKLEAYKNLVNVVERLTSRGQTAQHFATDSNPIVTDALLEAETFHVCQHSKEGLTAFDFITQKLTRRDVADNISLDLKHIQIKLATELAVLDEKEPGSWTDSLKAYERQILQIFAADLRLDTNYDRKRPEMAERAVRAERAENGRNLGDFRLTLLHIAAYYGCVSEVRKLLKLGLYNERVNYREKLTVRGQTALHFAIDGGPSVVAAILQAKTLVVSSKNMQGWTAVEYSDQKVSKGDDSSSLEHTRQILLDNQGVVEYLHKERQLSTNAIGSLNVVAALIASVTFAAIIHPPDSLHPEQNPGSHNLYTVQLFRDFCTAAFFLAIACLIFGAISGTLFRRSIQVRIHFRIIMVVVSLLLVTSIWCLIMCVIIAIKVPPVVFVGGMVIGYGVLFLIRFVPRGLLAKIIYLFSLVLASESSFKLQLSSPVA